MIRVVAAIIEHQNEILACQRRRDAAFALKWEFPGGKIQNGETPEAALVRELHEELGVSAEIGQMLYRATHRYGELADEIELTFFAATLPAAPSSGLPLLDNRVFERVSWVPRTDLETYDFLEADRPLVARLARGEFAAIQ